MQALEGLQPDGAPDLDFRGHDPSRNATMARFVLASGLRRREFTYLLAPEVPPLPPEPTVLPVLLPVPGKIAKGGKQRTTWVSYDALAAVHRYLELERPLAAEGSSWRPDPRRGEPLVVTYADWRGGVINGRRRPWSALGPSERLRLVDEQRRIAAGGSAAGRGAVRRLGHGASAGPLTGSATGSSPGSRMFTPTGCATRFPWQPWKTWSPAITPRPRNSSPTPITTRRSLCT